MPASQGSALARPLRPATRSEGAGALFALALAQLAAEHRPSRSPFFQRLAECPAEVARDPRLLGRVHLVYQAAMHATRAAVYHLPHLDSPALRRRKLQIFIDDDGLAGGDTHHYQLTRAFQNIGARLLLSDEQFEGSDELCRHLDPVTARFVRLAARLYRRSLGAWCVVELLSDDWMRALASAFAVHHPRILQEPYFAECFGNHVEERHADEALELTCAVLRRKPGLLAGTLQDAGRMAAALDSIWATLDGILCERLRPGQRAASARTKRRSPAFREHRPST